MISRGRMFIGKRSTFTAPPEIQKMAKRRKRHFRISQGNTVDYTLAMEKRFARLGGDKGTNHRERRGKTNHQGGEGGRNNHRAKGNVRLSRLCRQLLAENGLGVHDNVRPTRTPQTTVCKDGTSVHFTDDVYTVPVGTAPVT